MGVKTIAIQSPGDMGHAVGKVLRENGFDVITCLAGRSQRTIDLAREGNFTYATMRDLGKANDIKKIAEDEKLSLKVIELDVDNEQSAENAIKSMKAMSESS